MNPLARQDDGTLAVTVEVHHPGDVHFRYLAAHGRWFDDPDAHMIDEHGSTLRRDAAELIEVDGLNAEPVPAPPAGKKKAAAKKTAAKTKAAKKAAEKTAAKKTAAKKAAAKKAARKSG